jgi:bifunctional DNase/RNase
MIEMTIDSIRVSLMNYQRVVILKEKTSDRYLPIWIGPAEADAIAVKLQGVSVPRPLTHDLLGSVIESLGAVVNSIIVNDLKNDTFYAKVILDVDGKQVPIYADESVLDKAGILLDGETGRPILEEGEEAGGKAPRVNDEEMKKKMSAFYDFINTLDLDDFDKRKS